MIASALLAAYIAYWERRSVQDEIRELAAERTELLASTVRVSMQVLYSLQSLHAAAGRIEPEAFGLFARDARQRHPELQALEWAPSVAAGERATFESVMRNNGFPGFRITQMTPSGALLPSSERAGYFPVQWIEPLQGNLQALGLDMAQDSRRRAALERAAATREPSATAPLRLAQETGDQAGFLVFLPLYRGDDGTLEGFALAVFRCEDLIRHAMRDMDGRGIAFRIDDVGEQPPHRVFSSAAAGAPPRFASWLFPASDLYGTLDVAGRPWRLSFSPEAGFLGRHLPWQTAATFVAGLLVTTLVACVVRLLARRGFQVRQANAALQAEVRQRELAVQAAVAASQSKSTFLANMSHEIRTPMNAVLGYAQLLRRDARLDPGQREAVSAIVTSGSHLMSQINEVLDFSKIESGRIELHRIDFDLDAMLRDLERMFQPRCREKTLALSVAAAPAGRGWVHGDGVKLQQILINLLGNAVRFTSVGEVALRVRMQAEFLNGYRFDVIDTGPGIAEAERERIFEPFYQSPGASASGGSGLGLAIAKRQAELMGGRLEVASDGAAGSIFTLTLPLAPAEAGQAPTGGQDMSRRSLPPGTSLGVLVVDDGAANRDVLCRLLRDAGCTVHEAGGGKEALQWLASHSADLVFMDMRMPGMDGLAALEAVRRLPSPPRVIAYTAAAFEQDKARFLAAGCDGVVTKPIAVDALFDTLAAVSGRQFDRSAVAEAEDAPLREPDWDTLRVAPELLQRMATAAELHSTTVLKACLEELRAIGPEHELLARHLRLHARAYDMHAVARLLARINDETGGAAP